MASAWFTPRLTKKGERRYWVEYRLGGRESRILWGGSFPTQREARIRRDYIAGELAAGRVPQLRQAEPAAPLTVEAACRAWAASRIDVLTDQHPVRISIHMPATHDPRPPGIHRTSWWRRR